MKPRNRASLSATLAGLVIAGFCLQGCIATTVAGVGLGVAGAVVHTAVKATTTTIGTVAKVGGAALHLAGGPLRHKPKKPLVSG